MKWNLANFQKSIQHILCKLKIIEDRVEEVSSDTNLGNQDQVITDSSRSVTGEESAFDIDLTYPSFSSEANLTMGAFATSLSSKRSATFNGESRLFLGAGSSLIAEVVSAFNEDQSSKVQLGTSSAKITAYNTDSVKELEFGSSRSTISFGNKPFGIRTYTSPTVSFINFGRTGQYIGTTGSTTSPEWTSPLREVIAETLITIADPTVPTQAELDAVRALTDPDIVLGDVVTLIGNSVDPTRPQYSWLAVDDGASGVKLLSNYEEAIKVGNTLFVSKTGNDSTGQREDYTKHFATPWAAKLAALPGDEIIVYPGHYTTGLSGADFISNNNTESSLVGDSISYYLHEGVLIESITANHHLLFDNQNRTTSIDGKGVMKAPHFAKSDSQNTKLYIRLKGLEVSSRAGNMEQLKVFHIELDYYKALAPSAFHAFDFGKFPVSPSTAVTDGDVNIKIKRVMFDEAGAVPELVGVGAGNVGLLYPFSAINTNFYLQVDNMDKDVNINACRINSIDNCRINVKFSNYYGLNDSQSENNDPNDPITSSSYQALIDFSGFSAVIKDSLIHADFENINSSKPLFSTEYGNNKTFTNSTFYVKGRNIYNNSDTGVCFAIFGADLGTGDSSNSFTIDIHGETKNSHAIYDRSNGAGHQSKIIVKGRYKVPSGRNVIRLNQPVGQVSNVILDNVIMVQQDVGSSNTPTVFSTNDNQSLVTYNSYSNTAVSNTTHVVGTLTVNALVK